MNSISHSILRDVITCPCPTYLTWCHWSYPSMVPVVTSLIEAEWRINMRQLTWSLLFQIMAFRLFGAKSLSEPIMAYRKLELWEQTSVKLKLKYRDFHSRKCLWKYRLQNSCYYASTSMCSNVVTCSTSLIRHQAIQVIYLLPTGPLGIPPNAPHHFKAMNFRVSAFCRNWLEFTWEWASGKEIALNQECVFDQIFLSQWHPICVWNKKKSETPSLTISVPVSPQSLFEQLLWWK